MTAGYFEPGSNVEIRVESDPVVLGTLVARADGTVTSAYDLPLSVQIGSHIVYAKGPRLGTGVATEVGGVGVLDAAGLDDAGRVDQDVELAEAGDRLFDDPRSDGLVGDVAG